MPTFDFYDLTALSESDPRQGGIDTLQIHHTTTLSYAGARALMSPGGRVVSANGVMTPDGKLGLVVPLNRRAYTSATRYDHRSLTVECCNTSLAPDWGISAATHERLARLAYEMHVEYGMPLDRAHVIGHGEVPGTYATACPGPSMDLNWIVARANQIKTQGKKKGKAMDLMLYPVKGAGNTNRYFVFEDGQPARELVASALGSVQEQANCLVEARGIVTAAPATKAAADRAISMAAAFATAAPVGGVGGPTLAQIVAAVDAADDDEHAALVTAINAAAKANGTPADVVAAFKAAL